MLLIASAMLLATTPAYTELVSPSPEEGVTLNQALRKVKLSFAGRGGV